MKRPIEFTAKRVDNGQWVCGYYVVDPMGKHRIYLQPFPESLTNTYFFVDPETVSQFTGKHLAKGNKVYEGTIAFHEDERDFGDIRSYMICMWIDDWSMFAWLTQEEFSAYEEEGAKGLIDDWFWNYTFENSHKYHYAGNIFDNPELMNPTL
jgi:hypothetical protein